MSILSRVRDSAVADMFYPGDPATLTSTVHEYLQDQEIVSSQPKALIAPHAGYIYSGAIAASAYAALIPYRDKIRHVVLLGPSHRVGFRGIAACSSEVYRTPLGDITVDSEKMTALVRDLPFVHVLDAAHTQEHSLEVQLPFLQAVLDNFTLLPLVVGEAGIEEVDAVLERVFDGDDTLTVISSDLSHFHSDRIARKMDRETCSHIEQLDAEYLDPEYACGAYPVRGLLKYARDHHLQVRTVALGNSAKVSGDFSRVVGYGAWLFT